MLRLCGLSCYCSQGSPRWNTPPGPRAPVRGQGGRQTGPWRQHADGTQSSLSRRRPTCQNSEVMRDLHLWRLLQEPTLAPGEIVPLLNQLAELPLLDRLAFLGLMPAAVQHADAGVRAAALGVLAG